MAEEKAETEETTAGADSPVMARPIILGRKLGMLQMFKEDGSVGAGTTPGRVLKGMRMAARQGFNRVTVKNLEVLRADGERSLLVLSGAVPGPRNSIVMVRKA